MFRLLNNILPSRFEHHGLLQAHPFAECQYQSLSAFQPTSSKDTNLRFFFTRRGSVGFATQGFQRGDRVVHTLTTGGSSRVAILRGEGSDSRVIGKGLVESNHLLNPPSGLSSQNLGLEELLSHMGKLCYLTGCI